MQQHVWFANATVLLAACFFAILLCARAAPTPPVLNIGYRSPAFITAAKGSKPRVELTSVGVGENGWEEGAVYLAGLVGNGKAELSVHNTKDAKKLIPVDISANKDGQTTFLVRYNASSPGAFTWVVQTPDLVIMDVWPARDANKGAFVVGMHTKDLSLPRHYGTKNFHIKGSADSHSLFVGRIMPTGGFLWGKTAILANATKFPNVGPFRVASALADDGDLFVVGSYHGKLIIVEEGDEIVNFPSPPLEFVPFLLKLEKNTGSVVYAVDDIMPEASTGTGPASGKSASTAGGRSARRLPSRQPAPKTQPKADPEKTENPATPPDALPETVEVLSVTSFQIDECTNTYLASATSYLYDPATHRKDSKSQTSAYIFRLIVNRNSENVTAKSDGALFHMEVGGDVTGSAAVGADGVRGDVVRVAVTAPKGAKKEGCVPVIYGIGAGKEVVVGGEKVEGDDTGAGFVAVVTPKLDKTVWAKRIPTGLTAGDAPRIAFSVKTKSIKTANGDQSAVVVMGGIGDATTAGKLNLPTASNTVFLAFDEAKGDRIAAMPVPLPTFPTSFSQPKESTPVRRILVGDGASAMFVAGSLGSGDASAAWVGVFDVNAASGEEKPVPTKPTPVDDGKKPVEKPVDDAKKPVEKPVEKPSTAPSEEETGEDPEVGPPGQEGEVGEEEDETQGEEPAPSNPNVSPGQTAPGGKKVGSGKAKVDDSTGEGMYRGVSIGAWLSVFA
ncbi:hypothetical protein HK104_002171 [Borealophlyctis nickersoniae]|nr:hypothetical protein HK104_002171 [Borealophlyctis nickersoniae]